MVLITTFKQNIRTDIKTDIENRFTHGAIGTDDTTPTASDSALGAEVLRKAVDTFDKTTHADKIIASIIILPTEANGNDIVETGWFDASTAGNMHTRNLVNSISKTNDIQLYLDTQITIEVDEG